MKLWNTMKRLAIEDEGMEMVEWAIVGVVFAVAAAAFWGQLADSIEVAIGDVADTVENGAAAAPAP